MKTTKNNYQSLTLAIALAALVVATAACAPENPQLMPPPEQYKTGGTQAPIEANVVIKPKVDVLFVIDNSDSMLIHQTKLKENIDRFVEAFEKNPRLDFQIGVTAVFDSQRYGPVVTDFHPLGVLYPVRNAQREAVAGPAFITRGPNYKTILGETLKIGVIPRFKLDEKGKPVKAADGKKIDGGGPEYEETFSPVVAALDGRNAGFLRADAHLAVIMITDADDASAIAPSKLKADLEQAKGDDPNNARGGNFSTYAVLALDGCKSDPGIEKTGPVKIKEFLYLTKGRTFNLCDRNYGDKLAEVGRLIERKASRKTKILLEAIPEDKTLIVFFDKNKNKKFETGTDELVHGWKYDVNNVAVVVPGDVMDGRAPDEEISINYTPIDGRRIGTVRARPLSQGQ